MSKGTTKDDKAESFADRFGWWSEMRGDEWVKVLSKQPSFAEPVILFSQKPAGQHCSNQPLV